MKAWIVVNEFINTNKFTELNLWLLEAGKKKGIDIDIKTNAELMVVLGDSKDLFLIDKNIPSFVLFWDKDIRLAKALENKGIRVFNSAKAIEICDDKSLTHLALENAGIRMPKTIIAPMTFSGIGYTNYDFLNQVEKHLHYPYIIKECFGSFGQQVYKVENHKELLRIIEKIGTKPFLFQEYISSSHGRDIRINVVGDRAVAAMYRYNDEGDFRANISNGGKMKKYNPSIKLQDLAVECCKILNLDFAGVDFLFDENEDFIVCEVNSNAHFKNIYDCTNIDVADCIVDYIMNKI